MADQSFEGNGGGELSFEDAVDLQHENDELGLQNRKLVCEMNDLRQQIIQAEEANSVLLIQKDKLERKLEQSKISTEKVREHLGREIEETRFQLSSSEDRNHILRARILRLERENVDLAKSNDEIRKEANAATADRRIFMVQLKDLEEELKHKEESFRLQIQNHIMRAQETEIELTKLRDEITELESTNTLISRRRQDLESVLLVSHPQSLSDLKSNGNGSSEYSADVSDDDIQQSSDPSYMAFSTVYQKDSLHAELTESLGYPHDVSLPLVLQGLPDTHVGVQCDLVDADYVEKENMPFKMMTHVAVQCELDNLLQRQDRSTTVNFDLEESSNSNNIMMKQQKMQSRSTINLPVLPEEPEQEVRTHPTSLLHRMSSDRGSRPKLVRMSNVVTENPNINQKSSIWGVTMAIDNRRGTPSIGIIPEAEQEHMKRYAYDTVARSCEPDAEILSRAEWRTLKKDLNAKEHVQYKKSFGQDGGGGEADDVMRSTVNVDLDDEAEEHCENYSHLVEQLFQSLDDFKLNGKELDETDLRLISQRFEQLALVFKTDHMSLPTRTEATTKAYETAVGRMQDISSSLRQCLRKLRDHKLPGEIYDDLCSIEHVSQELEMYSSMLSTAAKRAGRIDLETRLCKMIEVMVLYVHILKTLHGNIEKDFCEARKLLEDNNIALPSKKSVGKLQQSINNNDEDKVSWDRTEIPDTHSEEMDRYLPEWYEVIRRELCWPWNWNQTWSGLKQGFAGFIMVVGLLVVAGNVVPNVAADDESENGIFRLCRILARHGIMTHYEVPRI